MPDIFGNIHLGYIVIETGKFADWRRFGRDAISMHLDETLPDVMTFRLDDNECRFCCSADRPRTPRPWVQVDDHSTFDEIVSRVARHGVPISEEAQRKPRCAVSSACAVPGTNRLAQEIFTSARTSDTAGNAVGGGFVTGEFGMGHVAITTKKPQQMRGYYDTVFDARLSDYIDETISGVKLKIRFLRVNERHHSVAIAAVNRLPVNPIRTRIQHLNIQVADLDDMTASYKRVKELGFDMALGVGQHTNDKELSYYAITPSGFEWEVGWNPIVVDENTWEPTTYQGISIWGHTPEGQTIVDKLAMFKAGARSLVHREESVPALAGAGIADN
jgi:2,3-dihydroxybiphenyl 1,2-dioxygenase